MKYKIIGIISCAVVLILSIAVPLFRTEDKGRYHQHLQAEVPKSCNHMDNTLCTHLPLVEIYTDGIEIPGAAYHDPISKKTQYTTTATGESELLCRVAIKDREGVNHHIDDEADMESGAYIRIRGNSSREFDKKGYLLNFVTSSGENNPQEVMGMDAHHEWALHGPFLDKTLLRNYMWYNIAGEIMDYSPNVRFCEVILNGEYKGLYLMTETICAGKNGSRLNLSVDKKDNSFAGYCLRLDRGSENGLKNLSTFTKYTYRIWGVQMNIEYPGTSNLTSEIAEGIRDDFNAFEKTMYSFDYDSKSHGYEETIDVDNFVKYLIINEFTCNYDAGSYSTYIYKDLDGLFRMCVWDYNNSCDNYQESVVNREDFFFQDKIWYFMFMKDKEFTEQCIKTYKELRKSYLNEEYLNNYIDETIQYLGDAITRNYDVWGYAFEKQEGLLYPADRNPSGYEEAVLQLKDFLKERGDWMDDNIDILRQFSAESKAKLYNEYTE